MSAAAPAVTAVRDRRADLVYRARVIRVIAHAEFKLKYSGSALGYFWSIAKPLCMFGILLVVFGRFFRLNGLQHYPIYLLLGLVMWTYFADATSLSMYSLVARGSLLTKLAFPRIVIPISVTVTVATTFGINLIAVAAFIGGSRIVPRPQWLILLPLLLELYVFTLVVSLILATLFVRLRDLGQLWDLILQLMFYAQPIIYPASFLPPWWRPVAFLSPFVQVASEARAAILPGVHVTTPTEVYGTAFGALLPIGVACAFLAGGYLLVRRESPRFAERI
jgi:ABC-2 type transport system permease protein